MNISFCFGLVTGKWRSPLFLLECSICAPFWLSETKNLCMLVRLILRFIPSFSATPDAAGGKKSDFFAQMRLKSVLFMKVWTAQITLNLIFSVLVWVTFICGTQQESDMHQISADVTVWIIRYKIICFFLPLSMLKSLIINCQQCWKTVVWKFNRCIQSHFCLLARSLRSWQIIHYFIVVLCQWPFLMFSSKLVVNVSW